MTGKRTYLKRCCTVVMTLVMGTLLVCSQQGLPDKPDLIRATVDHSDNGVLIQWEASTDNDIEIYKLYKMFNRTGTEIATFSADVREYKHMTSGLENLSYTVTAVDSSGNESLLEDNEHQVVAITHFPQVAASAAQHFLVGKKVEKGRTFSQMWEVRGEERIDELVRMLGGGGEEAREMAKSLL